jgi:FkbM family methyltransferase
MNTSPVTPEMLADPPPGVINAYGSLLKLDPADSLFLGSHDYEIYETRLALGLARPGDVAVDVGAMIGYYTLIFANRVGSTGRVYAFEPDPDNFGLLEENVRMNGYDHVTCRQAIVGDHTGRASLFPAPEQYKGDARAYATDGRPSIEVDVVRLDDVVDEPVDLAKIDVQGYEGHVLAGMHALIERSPQLTMLLEYCPLLLTEAGSDPGQVLTDLRAHGFVLFEMDESARQVRGVETAALLERAESGGDLVQGHTNLLCVKGQR